MRLNLPARASVSVSVLLSIFVLVSASAYASEDETPQQAERFDDTVGKRTRGTDGAKKAKPPADAPKLTPEVTPEPNEDTPAPDDAPPTSCEAARDLGVVNGDQGTPSISAHGSCSEWLRVRVTEAWKGPTAGTMRLTAPLSRLRTKRRRQDVLGRAVHIQQQQRFSDREHRGQEKERRLRRATVGAAPPGQRLIRRRFAPDDGAVRVLVICHSALVIGTAPGNARPLT